MSSMTHHGNTQDIACFCLMVTLLKHLIALLHAHHTFEGGAGRCCQRLHSCVVTMQCHVRQKGEAQRGLQACVCMHCCLVMLQAVLSAGQMYIATSTLVHDSSSPGYMRRPGIAWAQLSVSSSTQGIDSCPQSRAGVASRQAADWDTDFSQVWGLQVCQLSYRVYELTASDLPSSWDPNWVIPCKLS